MSNYKKHFHRELEILKRDLKEEDSLMIEDYIEVIDNICDIASSQGHSGGSAPYNANILANTIKSVLLFKPLSPITGDISEWNHTGDGSFQNNRLSSVFKESADGKPYYLDAITWQGEDDFDTFGGTIGGITSRQYIKLPFTPKTFYIHVRRELVDESNPVHQDHKKDWVSCRSGYYVYFIKDIDELDAVKEYYDFPYTQGKLVE